MHLAIVAYMRCAGAAATQNSTSDKSDKSDKEAADVSGTSWPQIEQVHACTGLIVVCSPVCRLCSIVNELHMLPCAVLATVQQLQVVVGSCSCNLIWGLAAQVNPRRMISHGLNVRMAIATGKAEDVMVCAFAF